MTSPAISNYLLGSIEKMPVLYVVAGPIGVGKSTLLKRLRHGDRLQRALSSALFNKASLKVSFLFEDTAEWERPREGAPEGMLKWFYQNPPKNGFAFQLYAFDQYVKMFHALVTREKPDVIIAERWMTCQYIFWELQAKNPVEQMVYDAHWRMWVNMVPAPQLVFRLETSSMNKLMGRVRRRARDGEASPSMDRPSITKSDTGIFVGGDTHERVKVSPREPAETEESFLMFDMEDINEDIVFQDDEEDDDGKKTEEGAGVTAEYQRRLIEGHRKAYPLGESRPFGISASITTKVLNADTPYHHDERAMRDITARIAGYIASAMRRKEYTQI